MVGCGERIIGLQAQFLEPSRRHRVRAQDKTTFVARRSIRRDDVVQLSRNPFGRKRITGPSVIEGVIRLQNGPLGEA